MRLDILRRAFRREEDHGTWVTDQVLGCPYPRSVSDLARLTTTGVTVVVNLHGRRHDPVSLAHYGLTETYLPVQDFSTPTPRQLDGGVATIVRAVADGTRVAIHCGGGLGRTGTLLACYLVHQGESADDAIYRLRLLRPGSIETGRQVRAVEAFEFRHNVGDGHPDIIEATMVYHPAAPECCLGADRPCSANGRITRGSNGNRST